MPELVPSPEATGGAGSSFEARLGAIALSRLLRGDRVPGLDAPPTRVRLQQRVAGAVLDDIVFDTDDPRGGVQWLEYQVKRTISITASDSDFRDLVVRVLGELERDPVPIEERRRRFGIATRPNPALAWLDRIVRTARAHDTADGFLQVLRTSAARDVRDRLTALRSVVAAALPDEATDAWIDTDTWRVAKSLYVWAVDAEPDTEDVRATLDRITDLLAGSDDAEDVFKELVDTVLEWAPKAGATNLAALRTRLETKGLALNEAPARRAAFHRLEEASRRLLDPAAATLGRRLHLPRLSLRRAVSAAIDEHDILLLAGRAGVGKSITARLVAHDLADDGAAIVAVNLSGRSGALALLEQELGAPIAAGLSGAPIGGLRVLIIDGAEQALTDGGQLLAAVLNSVPIEPGNAPPWRVLLTARDEALPTLTRLVEERTHAAPGVFAVAELDEAEIDVIVEQFPRLTPVDRSARARALLLRRPYLVELLVRAIDALDLPHDVAGEEDVLAIVNDRLIRLDHGGLPGRGAPYARADIFMGLGEAVVANALPARLDGTDPEARAGLSSDDIITEVRSSWRFAHDILADYAAATRLLESDGLDQLIASPSPRRLLRAWRLQLQREFADALASGQFAAAWHGAHQQTDLVAQADGPRWQDIPWEALLHLGAARAALDELVADLFANDGAELLRLIDVTERLARQPHTDEVEGFVPLDPTLSAPVIDLLVAHAAAVPDRVTLAAVRVVHQHLDACVAAGTPGAQLQRTAEIPDAVVLWTRDDAWGDRLEHAIGALALCGESLSDRHEAYLVAHARSRPHEVAEAVEGPRAASHLAKTCPDLLLLLSGLYYLGRGLTLTGEDSTQAERPAPRRSFALDDDEEGVRDHDPTHSAHLAMWPLGNNQSNPALGPFAALLDASPKHGLRLIGALVDTATAARSRLEAGYDNRRMGDDRSLELILSSGSWPTPLRFSGPATVWMWHRRTSTGPGPALSALMALREWAIREIRSGRPPRAMRDTLLSTGTSLAFVSVSLSVLVDRIDDVSDELDPLLVHPLVWRLEIARATHEHGGTALEIPEATRLSWNLSNIAVLLVLRADPERREALRRLGEAMVENHAELGSSDSEVLARRWAIELDVDHFMAESHDDGVAITVNYPAGVLEALQRDDGGAIEHSLLMAGLMFKAIQIRDGQAPLADAAEVWTDAVAGWDSQEAEGDHFGVYDPGDLLSAAAAVLVMAAAAGHAVDDDALNSAVEFLLSGAAYFAQYAPTDGADQGGFAASRSENASMCWDMGADRSIAMVLPTLLLDDQLRQRSGVTPEAVGDALESLASTPFDEARSRLVNHLLPAWALPCDAAGDPHRTAMRVATRLIATEGMSPKPTTYGYDSVMLPEPLEETIRQASEKSLDVAGASFGVVLAAAAECDCAYGDAARALVDVLIDFDHRAWPSAYARHHYFRSVLWRQAIDAALCDRVFSGDDAALDTHLDAFSLVGEELRGFLEALSEFAVDSATAARLHQVWPRILDRLLPDARSLEPIDGDHDRRPSSHDVEDLDRVLLLVPPDDHQWPLDETARLGGRWLSAYRETPHVADRAIVFVGRMFGFQTDLAIGIVLSILGDNITAILRQSHYALPWLQLVLRDQPQGEAASRARTLLDQLAATGDERALAAQQQLEA